MTAGQKKVKVFKFFEQCCGIFFRSLFDAGCRGNKRLDVYDIDYSATSTKKALVFVKDQFFPLCSNHLLRIILLWPKNHKI